jgi:hypothetical protein
MKFTVILFFLSFLPAVSIAQPHHENTFTAVVEKVIKTQFKHSTLATVCPLSDAASARVFADYGAVFVAEGVRLPGMCIFPNAEMVRSFQSQVEQSTAKIDGVNVTLQSAAMDALLSAREEGKKIGLTISPRGGSTASTRSYDQTVQLWRSRFVPALNYWVKKGRIKREEAIKAQIAPIGEQVEMVLAWEKKNLFFSKDMSKSILYSVAVPGASQHIFMLALDVEQYANKRVRQILAAHGWFQTVKSDVPHFTFLGRPEKDLASLGLMPVTAGGQTFWIPDIK